MVSSVLWFGTCHTHDPVIRVSTAFRQHPEQHYLILLTLWTDMAIAIV